MQSEPVEEDICRCCKVLSTSVSVIKLKLNLFSCRVSYPGWKADAVQADLVTKELT